MNNTNEPAFPNDGNHQFSDKGITKREYFAARAMQGLLASPYCHDLTNNINLPDLSMIAEQAVAYADALLKALES